MHRWMTISVTAAALLHPAFALGAETGGEGDHAAPPLLSADPGMAIWTLILFVLVILVLGRFVWPVITKGLDERERKIRGDIEAAETANKKAQQTLADYEKKLADAHAEARKLADQARADAEKVRQRLASETEAQITKMRERAAAEITDAKLQAVHELHAHAAKLSIAVAEKILQREITDADTQSLVESSLREMESSAA